MNEFESEKEVNNETDVVDSPNDSLIESGFVIVGKDEVSFIESYVEEKISKDSNIGDFFIVVEFVGMTVEEGEDIGESFTQTFRKAFYENLDLDPYSRFEEGLAEVNKVADDLVEDQSLDFNKLNIAIGAVVEDVVFVAGTGDAEIYLVRKGMVKNVAEGAPKVKNSDERLFCNVASGSLEAGDTLLLTTARLVRYVANTEVGKCFFNRSVNDGMEYLEDLLRMEVVGRVGILSVRVNGFNIPLEDEEPGKLANFGSKFRLGSFIRKEGVLPKAVYFARKAFIATKKAIVWLWNSSLVMASKIATLFAGRKIDFTHTKSKLSILAGVGIVSLVVIVVYLVFSISFISMDYKEAKAGLVTATGALQSAKSEPDKERAITMLAGVEERIKKAEEFKSLRDEAGKLSTELNGARALLDNVVVVSTPMVSADISKSVRGSLQDIVALGQLLYTYDNTNLYEFLSGIVKDPVKLVESNEKIVTMAHFEDSDSLVYLLDNGRLKEFSKSIVRYVGTTDDSFKSAVDLIGYGPRIYLLDSVGNQIWRYQKRRDVFGPAEPYVKSVNVSGFVGAVSMAIDGSVYVLFESGKIEKYYAGEKVPEFRIVNPPLHGLTSPTEIYTELGLPFVFVFEPSTKRILVFAKDSSSGNLRYTNQYYFDDLDELTGFTVDYTRRKLYVSDGKKVYSTNIIN